MLASKEGSHTELITIYVPPGKQISDAISMLRDEYGTASNIKSTATRKNVQEAIVKVQQRLKLFKDSGEKGLVIFCATLATAGAVCVSGIIGWVGLVIPHIGRMLVGNDNNVLVPASLSLGACFLILVDNLARMLTGSEIPLGILTALVGGPFFVFLLKKTKGGGW